MIPERWSELPTWLADSAELVLADIQGADPIPGLRLAATDPDGLDGVVLGVFEPEGWGGGSFVERALGPVELLLRIAEIPQDECAETAHAWGQARPVCPHHPHPARAVEREHEAWWICPSRGDPLFRVGRGEGGRSPKPRGA